AGAMRFRPGAVKQLPLERRIHYLLKNVHIDDSLALTLLLGLHLNGRADILATFLDELGIPQQGGLIDETHELQPPEPEALQRAVAAVY
ncbi:MAG: hypothetical protein GTO30_18660, partial [Acidobacteria bacterium]|nr:hypothetical protein [Acidobacteriota bacterium]NIQ86294.1 hypothetical protein [Acidobacteriota bacterium]